MLTAKQIRQQFLDFFAGKDHTIVDSSPVVPLDDPTLMFTNAGMNQFKDVFLGTGSRSYTRSADTQKCIRAGGKHNDLDDVGQDTYHHTFFEMLGNWSFGDYFKKEAIEWAWELMTKVWGIDKDRLHATYFEGDEAEGLEPDTEAAELWKTVTDINHANIHPGNKKDNFWEMGDTGPCGPCSEIHIDLTPDKSGASLVNAGDARVIELWNLVFIQYNRAGDGKLSPLPAKHVDTGMGFERIAAVLHGMETNRLGKVSNYDTDVFTPIFEAIQKRTNAPDYTGTLPTDNQSPERERRVQNEDVETLADKPPVAPDIPNRDREGAANHAHASVGMPPNNQSSDRKGAEQNTPPLTKGGPGGVTHEQIMVDVSYRVIADHIRCLTFALTDGAIPSNEKRGYVLRSILRRAVFYGRVYLNMHEPFLCDLVEPVIQHMGEAFPELKTAHGGKNIAHVTELVRDEEVSFGKTLARGIKLFNEAADYAIQFKKEEKREIAAELGLYDDCDESTLEPTGVISGGVAFVLHATYGFPIGLTKIMAEKRGMVVDIEEFERIMEEARQKSRSKTNRVLTSDVGGVLWQKDAPQTEFVGYKCIECDGRILRTVRTDTNTFGAAIYAGQEGVLVLDKSPFYTEKGGQVGDAGTIITPSGEFHVEDTREIDGIVAHIGRCIEGEIHPFNELALNEPLPHIADTDTFEGIALSKFPAEERKRVSQIIQYKRETQERDLRVEHSKREPARAKVCNETRLIISKNHTTTHIMNWALREVLCSAEERDNPHVQQKGSLVDPDKTRFDFSHNKPLTDDELNKIESLVNEQIKAGYDIDIREVDQNEARKINTLRAVFGEKYPDTVRVVSIGADIEEMLADPKNEKWMQYSVEFCGGTHLQTSSEADHFVLISEEGVAKGIRRVVGISGEAARNAETLGLQLLDEINTLENPSPEPHASACAESGKSTDPRGLPTSRDSISPASQGADKHAHASVEHATPDPGTQELGTHLSAFQQKLNESDIPLRVRHQLRDRVAQLQKKVKEQQKQASAASGVAAMDIVATLFESAETIGGVTVVVGEIPGANADALRGAIDWVRNKTESSIVFLVTSSDEKVTLIAGMSKTVVKNGIKAGDLIKEIAPIVGGRGGGRPDMAQGGGSDPTKIPEAIDKATSWIADKLS